METVGYNVESGTFVVRVSSRIVQESELATECHLIYWMTRIIVRFCVRRPTCFGRHWDG